MTGSQIRGDPYTLLLPEKPIVAIASAAPRSSAIGLSTLWYDRCHDKHAATHREIALLTYRNGDTRRTCGKLGIGTDYLGYSPSSPQIVMDGFSSPNFDPCVRVWGYFVWKYFQL